MRYHKHLLQSCLEALTAIFYEDRYADKCIEFYLRNNKKWGSRDRRFFAETVYDGVRWWNHDWAVTGREPGRPDFQFLSVSLWRRGLPLPELHEFKDIRYEDFEKNQSRIKEPYLINAFPKWLFQRIADEVGPDWIEMAPYFNETNEVVLRVNQQKTNRAQLIEDLRKLDIPAQALLGTETGVVLRQRDNVFRTDLFKKGHFEVQDGSSQQVAPFLQIAPGQRVIDACAGAGGKTLHIADLMQNKGKIISLDIHQWKLDQLKLRARRNSYSNIEMRVIDGSKTIKRLKSSADRLLLDVPCTGLGVLRRNPDTKWKLSAQRIDELRELQSSILQDYSGMLKPGGLMIYSTCSVLPFENEKQVEAFLQNNSQFSLLKQRWLYPTRPGYDGFYMALMQRS